MNVIGGPPVIRRNVPPENDAATARKSLGTLRGDYRLNEG